MINDTADLAPVFPKTLHRQPRPTRWIVETDQLFFGVLVLMLVAIQLLAGFGVYLLLLVL